MKNIQDIIRAIENNEINESSLNTDEGVIMVDSIDDYAKENNLTKFEEIERVLFNEKGPLGTGSFDPVTANHLTSATEGVII